MTDTQKMLYILRVAHSCKSVEQWGVVFDWAKNLKYDNLWTDVRIMSELNKLFKKNFNI